jgi:leukotriene-A4 hydrolase
MTVWLERKIVGRTKGGEASKLSAQIGMRHLKDDMARMGEASPFTRLVWPLEGGADPDDAFSSVPYEKVTRTARCCGSMRLATECEGDDTKFLL